MADRPRRKFDAKARLQTKEGICRYLGDIGPGTYDAWHAKGLVPGPVPGTNRYDVRQHDHVLDLRVGLTGNTERRLSPLEEWEAAHADQAEGDISQP
jgi:hypothetical protein